MKWILRMVFRHLKKNLDADAQLQDNILTVVVTYDEQVIFSKRIDIGTIIHV
jgi:hypothetical protein